MIDDAKGLHCGTWIALSLERQTIQGYVDDGEFIEGPSETPTTHSQRELMRHRLWRIDSEVFFEDSGHRLWSGTFHSAQGEHSVEFIDGSNGSEQREVWFEVDSELVMFVETIFDGQYLKREKWVLQRLLTIESTLYGVAHAPCLLKAIGDQPLDQCEFNGHLDLRQWSISSAELMVLLERPELSETKSLDIRDTVSEDPEQLQWVLQNAWHSEHIRELHLNTETVVDLPGLIQPRSLRTLGLSGAETNSDVFDALSNQKQLVSLDLGKSRQSFSMECIAQSTMLESLTFQGTIHNWVPLILQNLKILKLPEMAWGDWIEDLQLHQMSAFQIGSTIPSREILHLEELQHLDMHMPNDAIDSFSLSTIVLRGGQLDATLMHQIRIGCPLLRKLHLINVDIQAGVLPLLVDLECVLCESCRIQPDNIPETEPLWSVLSFRDTIISESLLLRCLSSHLRSLDVTRSQTSIRMLLMNPNLIHLEALWADGAQDVSTLFEANALVSLKRLSIRDTDCTVKEVLSKQALLSLQTLDIGGTNWGNIHSIKAHSVNPLQTLRISPHNEPMMLNHLRKLVRPSAVPRLVHIDPLLRCCVYPQNLGVP